MDRRTAGDPGFYMLTLAASRCRRITGECSLYCDAGSAHASHHVHLDQKQVALTYTPKKSNGCHLIVAHWISETSLELRDPAVSITFGQSMKTHLFLPISTFSALGMFHVMRYINVRYLLTYLLTYGARTNVYMSVKGDKYAYICATLFQRVFNALKTTAFLFFE